MGEKNKICSQIASVLSSSFFFVHTHTHAQTSICFYYSQKKGVETIITGSSPSLWLSQQDIRVVNHNCSSVVAGLNRRRHLLEDIYLVYCAVGQSENTFLFLWIYFSNWNTLKKISHWSSLDMLCTLLLIQNNSDRLFFFCCSVTGQPRSLIFTEQCIHCGARHLTLSL